MFSSKKILGKIIFLFDRDAKYSDIYKKIKQEGGGVIAIWRVSGQKSKGHKGCACDVSMRAIVRVAVGRVSE